MLVIRHRLVSRALKGHAGSIPERRTGLMPNGSYGRLRHETNLGSNG
jgi:hypothetical protein